MAIAWRTRWFLAKSVLLWMLLESATVFLDHLTTGHEVGIFAIAVRSLGIVTLPFGILGLIALPWLSYQNTLGHSQMFEQALRIQYIQLMMIPGIYALAIGFGMFFIWASGEAYDASQPVLRVLAVAYILYFGTFTGIPLIVLERERAVVASYAAGMVCLVLLCLFLVPSRGAIGAAIACLGAYFLVRLLILAAYVATHVPVGDRRHLAVFCCVVSWLLISFYLPPSLEATWLAVGGLMSASLSFRLLSRLPLSDLTSARR
jgi:O-antigen/teichoic acid export membrane protein